MKKDVTEQRKSVFRKWKESGKLASVGFQISIYAFPLTLFAIFWIGTNINSILLAFQDVAFDGTKTWAGFHNFVDFIREMASEDGTLLSTSFKNSIKMFLINLAICMPLYLLFSFYIFKKLFANRFIMIVIMVPAIVSEFIIAMVFKRFVGGALPSIAKSVFGLSGFPDLLTDPKYTFLTVIFYMIWTSFSTSLIIYPNAMRAIDPSLFESAQMDGAGWWTQFWKIILPLIYPTISTFLILGVSGLFLTAGPVMTFYMYGAYPEVYTMGYYFTVQTMTAVGESTYPFLAAGGLILTLVSCPLTFGTKFLLDRFDPTRDMA